MELVEVLKCSRTFLSGFLDSLILNKEMVDIILSKSTQAEQNRTFLDIIIRRGPKAMKLIIWNAIKTDQNEVLDILL
jgi:hypothetical protein